MTYSFPNFEPASFSMSSSNYCFLTCILVSQEAGKVAWYSHHIKNFPQLVVIHTEKGFRIANEADVFLEFSWEFYILSFYIWKFSVHVLLKSRLENFEHYVVSMRDECNCVVICTFCGIAFLWDLNENWYFPVSWPLLSFPNLLAYWVQHFHSIIF